MGKRRRGIRRSGSGGVAARRSQLCGQPECYKPFFDAIGRIMGEDPGAQQARSPNTASTAIDLPGNTLSGIVSPAP